LYNPSEKVQLSYGSFNHLVFLIIELDPLPSAKRIKVLLGVCLELRAITQIHIKMYNIVCGIRLGDDGAVFLAIVGYKPIQQSKGYIGFPLIFDE
jgi:hypothetical protein